MTEQIRSVSAEQINDMEARYRANFVNSLSGFKSACLLGTSDGQTDNLAIVSSPVHIGANPPLLGLIMRPHSVQRDSLSNIKQFHDYTLNHVHHSWTDKAHQTAARYPADTSEFSAVGLTPWYSTALNAPYVAESHVKIGLRLVQRQVLCNDTELLIGAVQEVLVTDTHIADDGYVDLEALGSACISGLDSYHQTTRLAQYAYAKPDQPLHQKNGK
ncbi:flavin reductase family protein [Alteromonas halophila]|uniref:Flavin oxidoreductase n=1 Tax=Alteromonas halophila TaxID=516698 RepID=A0A918JN10_9ALTE|nr:flavin reductase [Alteromonas halophila]GGW90591.1 flavin oxidoreductase [Alteromonas halophila]